MAEKYGYVLAEQVYLSRLHAMLVNSGYRGKFTGVEPVNELFGNLRKTKAGTALAARFVSNFGDGGSRTDLETIRVASANTYRDFRNNKS